MAFHQNTPVSLLSVFETVMNSNTISNSNVHCDSLSWHLHGLHANRHAPINRSDLETCQSREDMASERMHAKGNSRTGLWSARVTFPQACMVKACFWAWHCCGVLWTFRSETSREVLRLLKDDPKDNFLDPVNSFPSSILPLSVLIPDHKVTSFLSFIFSAIASGTSSRGLGNGSTWSWKLWISKL